MIQVYAAAQLAADDELDDFYEHLQEAVDVTTSGDVLMILGDFNSKVGKMMSKTDVIGTWGLGNRNEPGEHTQFPLHNRRLYTWTSSNKLARNEIDYILINERWKFSIQKCRTCTGADLSTDHELLVAKLALKLKMLHQPMPPALRF